MALLFSALRDGRVKEEWSESGRNQTEWNGEENEGGN